MHRPVSWRCPPGAGPPGHATGGGGVCPGRGGDPINHADRIQQRHDFNCLVSQVPQTSTSANCARARARATTQCSTQHACSAGQYAKWQHQQVLCRAVVALLAPPARGNSGGPGRLLCARGPCARPVCSSAAKRRYNSRTSQLVKFNEGRGGAALQLSLAHDGAHARELAS